MRLILSMVPPFDGITLVHKVKVNTQEEAEQFAKTLPQGFVVVEDSAVPAGSVQVPMQTPTMREYGKYATMPVEVGCLVYLQAEKQRGIVTKVLPLTITIGDTTIETQYPNVVRVSDKLFSTESEDLVKLIVS